MIPEVEVATKPVRGNPGGFMTEYEREVLVSLARSMRAQSILEIGVQEGQAAQVLLDNVDTIQKYDAVDVLPGYQPEHEHQTNEITPKVGYLVTDNPKFNLILKARGSLDLTPDSLLPTRYDLVLIDGDHGRAAVTHDTALARAVVKKNGLVVWHDYDKNSPVDVYPVLNEMYEKGAKLLHVKGTWLVVERWVERCLG